MKLLLGLLLVLIAAAIVIVPVLGFVKFIVGVIVVAMIFTGIKLIDEAWD